MAMNMSGAAFSTRRRQHEQFVVHYVCPSPVPWFVVVLTRFVRKPFQVRGDDDDEDDRSDETGDAEIGQKQHRSDQWSGERADLIAYREKGECLHPARTTVTLARAGLDGDRGLDCGREQCGRKSDQNRRQQHSGQGITDRQAEKSQDAQSAADEDDGLDTEPVGEGAADEEQSLL